MADMAPLMAGAFLAVLVLDSLLKETGMMPLSVFRTIFILDNAGVTDATALFGGSMFFRYCKYSPVKAVGMHFNGGIWVGEDDLLRRRFLVLVLQHLGVCCSIMAAMSTSADWREITMGNCAMASV